MDEKKSLNSPSPSNRPYITPAGPHLHYPSPFKFDALRAYTSPIQPEEKVHRVMEVRFLLPRDLVVASREENVQAFELFRSPLKNNAFTPPLDRRSRYYLAGVTSSATMQ